MNATSTIRGIKMTLTAGLFAAAITGCADIGDPTNSVEDELTEEALELGVTDHAIEIADDGVFVEFRNGEQILASDLFVPEGDITAIDTRVTLTADEAVVPFGDYVSCIRTMTLAPVYYCWDRDSGGGGGGGCNVDGWYWITGDVCDNEVLEYFYCQLGCDDFGGGYA